MYPFSSHPHFSPSRSGISKTTSQVRWWRSSKRKAVFWIRKRVLFWTWGGCACWYWSSKMAQRRWAHRDQLFSMIWLRKSGSPLHLVCSLPSSIQSECYSFLQKSNERALAFSMSKFMTSKFYTYWKPFSSITLNISETFCLGAHTKTSPRLIKRLH